MAGFCRRWTPAPKADGRTARAIRNFIASGLSGRLVYRPARRRWMVSVSVPTLGRTAIAAFPAPSRWSRTFAAAGVFSMQDRFATKSRIGPGKPSPGISKDFLAPGYYLYILDLG